MKKKDKMNTSQQIQILIGFIGILLVVVTYFFVYKKYNEKSASIESSNSALQAEVTRLQTLDSNRETYLSETDRMQSYIKDFESKFPAYTLPEDSIMLIKNMEDATNTEISTISFGGQTPVTVDVSESGDSSLSSLADPNTEEMAAADAAAGGTGAVTTTSTVQPTQYSDTTLYENPLGITMACTYDDFKGLIRYIYAQQERMSVKGVNISYNRETGALSGDMTLDTYYLIGTEKTYTETKLPSISTGVDTIFGNIIQ
jgi:hypothetical protein